MKKKFYKYGLFYIGVVLAACADNADLNEPTGSTTPPSQVLNATVKNLPGAAIIYYDLPDDQNLKYVRASYKVDNMIRTVNASFYTDSLVVEDSLLRESMTLNFILLVMVRLSLLRLW